METAVTQRFRVKGTFSDMLGYPIGCLQVVVTPHLATNALITHPGNIIVPDSAYGHILDGVLVDDDGQDGIELMSDTDDLNLSVPLFYRLTIFRVQAGSVVRAVSEVAFPASTDDTDVQLVNYIPSPATPESTVITIPIPHGDGSTFLNDQGQFTEPDGDTLPTQAGHAGEFLTTDGSDPSWALQRVTITDEDKDDIVSDVENNLEPPVDLTILFANSIV